MKKVLALIQVIVIILIVGYGTFHLFKGNFEVAIASLPLLMCYYVFMVARHRKSRLRMERDGSEE